MTTIIVSSGIKTATLTPGDSHNIEIQGLDNSYVNTLCLIFLKKSTSANNILPPFSSGLLCFVLDEIPETGIFSKDLILGQSSALLSSASYKGEVQLIKADGDSESLFFNVNTNRNYIDTVEPGEVDNFNYQYLGRYSELPGVAEENSIVFNTSDSIFYIYKQGWTDIAAYTTDTSVADIIDGGNATSVYTIIVDGGNS